MTTMEALRKPWIPVYDRHGLVDYYQKSGESYDKTAELYDRNGELVRSQLSDNLEAYNHAAYGVHGAWSAAGRGTNSFPPEGQEPM